MEHYKKQFKTPGNRRWLKGSVAVGIAKCGLAPFTSDKAERLRSKSSSSGVICTICSTPNIVKCNSSNNICKPYGRCKLHSIPNTKQRVTYRPCQNNTCDIIRDYLITLHRCGSPSWLNVDAQKWCQNAWQIAKAFFPPNGYKDKENVDETDFNGIISFIINCQDFQQHFYADLSQSSNICTQARDAGKNLRHAPGLEVSEHDLKIWFTDLKALFRDPTFQTANPNAQYALDQLEELEKDELQILNSDIVAAIQDSVDYLRQLTSSYDLQNVDITLKDIKENLIKLEEIKEGIMLQIKEEGERQCKIIEEAGKTSIKVAKEEIETCTEVAQDKIKKETQTSIKFAQDEIRKRVKHDVFPNDNEFKTDLKAKLINYHQKQNASITLGPFIDIEASLQEIYTTPIIERVTSKVTTKSGTEKISSWKTILDPENQQFICVTAEAGVGKSIFCQFAIEIWCAGDTISIPQSYETFLEDVSFLQEFHYLFYIQLQGVEITSSNIDDILFCHSKTVDSTLTKDNESFDKILSQEKGLIILDGLDEYPIKNVLHVPGNRKYSVMITSRPWKFEKLNISAKKHFHAYLKEMEDDNIKDLLKKAIVCINKEKCTSMELPDFMALVDLQGLKSLLSNPLIALLLLRIYYEHETEETDKAICDTRATPQVNDECCSQNSVTIYERTTQKKKKSLGKTRAHIYANVIEMMLQSDKSKDEQRFEELSRSYNEYPTLPECFVEATACELVAKLIYSLGKLSWNSLLQGNGADLSEYDVETKLRAKYEKDVLRGSGLLTKSKQKYGFSHHSFKEMFASVFLSSLSQEEFLRQFQGKVPSNISPNIMSFLCVMKYEMGRKCLAMFNEIERNFYDEEKFFSADLQAYQSAVLLAFDECVQNGIEKPDLAIMHAMISFNSAIDIDHQLLRGNVHSLETLFLVNLDVGVTTDPLVFGYGLKVLCLNEVNCVSSIDLSACKRLSQIILQDSHIFEVIITPTNIEELWIYIESDIMITIPPMKLTFSGASHFSERLKRLCLENIVLDTPLNLSHCKELRDLEIEKMYSSEENVDFISFSNLECCENLEELRLDTLQFTVNDFLVNQSEQSSEKNKSAENCNLHAIDCSGLKRLRSITLHDCNFTEIIIDPLHLEEFWIYVSPDQICQPKMNVSFCGSSRFSSNLTMLSLVNVGNIPDIDISECVNLQKLRIDRPVTFEKELNHLTEVRIFSVGQNVAKSILEKIASYQSLGKLCLENLASDVLNFIFDHASSFDTVACLNICDVDLTGLDLDFVRKCSAKKVTFKDDKLHCSQVKVITKECKRDGPLRKSTMIEKEFKFKNCRFVGVSTDLEYLFSGKSAEGILNQNMEATSEIEVGFREVRFQVERKNVD